MYNDRRHEQSDQQLHVEFDFEHSFLAHPRLRIVDPVGLECVLAAGDAGDIAEIQDWLFSLPEHTFGQVFIEVFSPIQIVELFTPKHISVTWITREKLRPSSRPGIGIPRGSALRDAVDAWLNEWARPEGGSHVHIWAGARSSSIMNRYWLMLQRELKNVS
ncbi:SIP domain-containing protein [Leucobacter sp. OH1287]|uniref:SIP domain-containing protein n=1 Tax=Leucobacter sp. OH1287 TaxID=2491049 RepID=UPI000F5DB41A|nr:SIP domain-containing protein [Leucobacter sp. OH1287]RRD60119.1 hypothetical protein EII30_06855 [Leucobacter sp. OH1287]